MEPNVHAACFLLTNMDPDNWKNKVDNTTDLNVELETPPVIEFGEPESEEPSEE